jgi:hypothetical protein
MLLVGCGGGGVGIGSQLRMLQAGNQWVYRATTVDMAPGEPTITSHSQLTFTVVNRTFQGQQRTALEVSDQEVTAQGAPIGSPVVTFAIFQQDQTTGDLHFIGEVDEFGDELPFTAQTFLRGTLTPGDSWQYVQSQEPGQPVVTLTVAGQETATVPLGAFATWRIDGNKRINNVVVEGQSLWVHPNIVLPVRWLTTFGLDDPDHHATTDMVLVQTNAQ